MNATNPGYDKYLDAFGFVLVSRNNLCALKQITEVVREQLRRTMQMKAFRLNEYENSDSLVFQSV